MPMSPRRGEGWRGGREGTGEKVEGLPWQSGQPSLSTCCAHQLSCVHPPPPGSGTPQTSPVTWHGSTQPRTSP